MDTNEVPEWMARSTLAPAPGDISLRDWLAINATDDQIARFRGSYRNPAGGFQIFHKHTIERARYLYADAMLEARNGK